MTSSKLLLDFDGVVLRNTKLHRYQLNRSARFVQKHTGMSLERCKKVNAEFYPKDGHTVTMINKRFVVDESDRVTLEEYNDYVFGKQHLRWLKHLVDDKTHAHAKDFNRVFEFCEKNNMQWYVFTNAHIEWVLYFSHLCNLPITMDKVIWPPTLQYLKPSRFAYDYVECRFPAGTFWFADDSQTNLQIPMQRERWVPMYFTKNHTADSLLDVIKHDSSINLTD